MSNDIRNYYERELDLIDFNGEHPAKILIGSEGKTTRTLDINKESAVALIHKLAAFLIDDPLPPDPAPAKSRLYVYYTIGRDKNGNKLVHVKTSGRGGFSIQTNGNLPQTHRDGVTSETDAEVCAYVRRHGSDRRKRVLDIQ
jgi:hypothetical protein